MFGRAQRHRLTSCVDFVTAVLFVPFTEIRSLVHVLDDLSPAYPGVVSAERDLAFLSAVWNYAHLGTAEVVVEQILEPHSLNTQHAPNVVRFARMLRLHPIISIGIGIG